MKVEDFIKEHFPGLEKETWYPVIVAVAEGYHDQFKQPPVSVMPSAEEIGKYLKKEGFLTNKHGQYVYTCSNNEHVVNLKYALYEFALSLSKEAPKEQDKERETAIEFNEWLCEEGWIRRPFPEPNHEYLYDDHLVNNDDFNYKNGKTGSELFDLFKQRNQTK